MRGRRRSDLEHDARAGHGYALVLVASDPVGAYFERVIGTEVLATQPFQGPARAFVHAVAVAVAVYDGSDSTLYIDGARFGSFTDDRSMRAHAANAFIGAVPDPAANENHFHGVIDEVVGLHRRATGRTDPRTPRHRLHRRPHREPGCLHEVRDVVPAAGEAVAAAALAAPELHDQLVRGAAGGPLWFWSCALERTQAVHDHVLRSCDIESRARLRRGSPPNTLNSTTSDSRLLPLDLVVQG